jgi:murein DD-endopeptidase MepM/ murein hydrolase activator NlpD
MRSGRGYIVWLPRKGRGKIRKCLIHPFFVGLFLFLALSCMCSVPFLQRGLHTLIRRIDDLEREKQRLQSEIFRLHYIRIALARIEEKERMLRDYFGVEEHKFLEQAMGGIGEPGYDFSRVSLDQVDLRDGSYEGIVSPNMSLQRKLQVLDTNYEIFNQLMVEQKETWENTPSIIPAAIKNPKISSGFGWRRNPFTDRREFHAGIDIVGPKGTRIIAPARGVVITKGYDQSLGLYVVLQHTGEIKTIFGHLHEISVDKGMHVKRGDLLGFMGNTGMSTNRHLHYTVLVNGRAVDPMQFILDMGG